MINKNIVNEMNDKRMCQSGHNNPTLSKYSVKGYAKDGSDLLVCEGHAKLFSDGKLEITQLKKD